MMDLNSRVKSVADRERWAARGASFMAKLKATKMVWFPPDGVDTAKATAATAKKTTRRAAKKSTSAAKKTTGPAKKTARSTKKVTQPANASKS